MAAIRTVSPLSSLAGAADASARRAAARRATHSSFLLRLLAILLLGVMLVLLSGLIQAAAAAWLATSSPGPAVAWAIAAGLAVLIGFGARTARSAWSKLCLLNGVASGIVLLASLFDAEAMAQELAQSAEQVGLSGVSPSPGAFGGALVSGALGLSALALLIGFFAASWLLHRHDQFHRHAL